MDKNNISRIVKTIFLQQKIAKQLFAAFDPRKDDIAGLGNMLNISEKLGNNFSVFIGSQNVADNSVLQFIQKNGSQYRVYGLNANGQVDNKFSITFDSLSKLINSLYICSSTMVSQADSFNSNFRRLNGVLGNAKIYDTYKDETFEKSVYQRNDDQVQAKKQIASTIVNQWLNDICNILDNIRSQMQRILLFKINNSQRGIQSYINEIQIIISSSGQYLSKLTDDYYSKNQISTIVNQIQSNILQHKEIQNLKNYSLHQINESQKTNIDDLGRKVSNVVGKLKGISQIIKQLNSYNGQQDVAEKILFAIEQSNDSSELNNNLKSAIEDFDVNTNVVQYLNQHGNTAQIPFTKEDTGIKSKLQTFSEFIYGQSTIYPYKNWDDIYENYFSYYYGDDVNFMRVVDNFDAFIKIVSSYQFAKLVYDQAKAYSGVITLKERKLKAKGNKAEEIEQKIVDVNNLMVQCQSDIINKFATDFGNKLIQYIKDYVDKTKSTPGSFDIKTPGKAKGFFPLNSLPSKVANLSPQFEQMKKLVFNM